MSDYSSSGSFIDYDIGSPVLSPVGSFYESEDEDIVASSKKGKVKISKPLIPADTTIKIEPVDQNILTIVSESDRSHQIILMGAVNKINTTEFDKLKTLGIQVEFDNKFLGYHILFPQPEEFDFTSLMALKELFYNWLDNLNIPWQKIELKNIAISIHPFNANIYRLCGTTNLYQITFQSMGPKFKNYDTNAFTKQLSQFSSVSKDEDNCWEFDKDMLNTVINFLRHMVRAPIRPTSHQS